MEAKAVVTSVWASAGDDGDGDGAKKPPAAKRGGKKAAAAAATAGDGGGGGGKSRASAPPPPHPAAAAGASWDQDQEQHLEFLRLGKRADPVRWVKQFEALVSSLRPQQSVPPDICTLYPEARIRFAAAALSNDPNANNDELAHAIAVLDLNPDSTPVPYAITSGRGLEEATQLQEGALLHPLLLQLVKMQHEATDTTPGAKADVDVGPLIVPEFVTRVIELANAPEADRRFGPNVLKALVNVGAILQLKDTYMFNPGDIAPRLIDAVKWLAAPVRPASPLLPLDRETEVRRWFVCLLTAARTKDTAWAKLVQRLRVPACQVGSLKSQEAFLRGHRRPAVGRPGGGRRGSSGRGGGRSCRRPRAAAAACGLWRWPAGSAACRQRQQRRPDGPDGQ